MPKAVYSKDSGLKKFIKENKSLAVLLPLLAVLIVVFGVVYLGGGGGDKSASGNPARSPEATGTPASDKPQVEILPQTERSNGESAQNNQDTQNSLDSQGSLGSEPAQDPFKSPMKLTGVLIYSNLEATAIIEYGGVSYVTKLNENVGDTPWKITSITDKNATLESDGKSVTLELNMEHSME